MRNLLLQRLNPDGTPAQPAYRLETNLSVTKERTGIQITEEATRARLTVSVSFRLYEGGGNGKMLYGGSEQSTNSYNVADSQFATLNAENDAARRAVREVSDSIRLRLGLYFQRAQDS
jgi:LPS-assembly lipoprotein